MEETETDNTKREWYTLSEIATHSERGRQAVYIAIVTGKLKAKKIDNRWVIKMSDFDDFKSRKYQRWIKKPDGQNLFDGENFFSLPQVIEIFSLKLGCKYSYSQMYYKVQTGQLKASRQGATWIIKKEDLQKYLSQEQKELDGNLDQALL